MSFNPDEAAVLPSPWDITFLSQRDIGLDVPVNYVTTPGVSLQSACFGNDRYEDDAIVRCLSNLLEMGFERVIVDVYWDAGRGLWSLCPAELSETASSADDTAITANPMASSTVSISSVGLEGSADIDGSDVLGGRAALPNTAVARHAQRKRQEEQPSPTITQTALQLPPALSISQYVSATSASSSDTGDDPLIQIGPYSCTATANLQLISTIFATFLSNTSTNLKVDLLMVDLNLHVAASNDAPTQPAQAPTLDMLPTSTNLVSYILNADLASYIYTPSALRDERLDLNSTWYAVPAASLPISEYFTLNTTGPFSTTDGWPSLGYINLEVSKRLAVAFNRIDPQLSAYSSAGDADYIFFAGNTLRLDPATFSSTGTVTSSCFFDAAERSITDRTNNSWASTTDLSLDPSNNFSASALSNLTACGISPILNQTLLNRTADQDPALYLSFVQAARIWSWAPSQPVVNSDDQKCAVMDPSLSGRWRAVDCNDRYVAACRHDHDPYRWSLTSERGQFGDISSRCPANTTFGRPNTALENTYLLSHVRDSRTPSDGEDPIFLSIQSLGFPNCWVSGVDTPCPYETNAETENSRTVVVPTVAAVIVFAVAALTVFVKCAANRSNDKRRQRRKGDDRGDYEGVPS